jgi:adenylate kinase family enzyme
VHPDILPSLEFKVMRRVLIIGSAGAGKSTLATRLAAKLQLPVIHLDAVYWQPGWKETPKDEWQARVAELIQRDAWIMDGNYGGTMEMRVQAADTVILLDTPRTQCLFRVFKRALRYRGKTRPDMNPGCPEMLPDWEFIRWIWTYPKLRRPEILDLLSRHDGEKRILILRSSGDVERFLMTVNGAS